MGSLGAFSGSWLHPIISECMWVFNKQHWIKGCHVTLERFSFIGQFIIPFREISKTDFPGCLRVPIAFTYTALSFKANLFLSLFSFYTTFNQLLWSHCYFRQACSERIIGGSWCHRLIHSIWPTCQNAECLRGFLLYDWQAQGSSGCHSHSFAEHPENQKDKERQRIF